MTASQTTGRPSGFDGSERDAGVAAGAAGVDDLRRDVEETAEMALERGRGFAAAAKSHAINYAEGRKVETARSVSELAASLRDSGKTFDDRPNIKAFFDSAAEGLTDLAGTIENRSFGEFYADAEAFARRSPLTVAAATFAAGFLFARFVKASGTRDADDRYGL